MCSNVPALMSLPATTYRPAAADSSRMSTADAGGKDPSAFVVAVVVGSGEDAVDGVVVDVVCIRSRILDVFTCEAIGGAFLKVFAC